MADKEQSLIEKAKSAISKPAQEKKEEKIELQREYVVPMRRGFLKVPSYRKAKKAILVLKQFIAKHMKVENRDLNKVKLDMYLNNEIWSRGIKNPLHKIKVKAVKKAGIVYVELAEVPDFVKYEMQKAEKRLLKVQKSEVKAEAPKEEPKTEGEVKEEKEDDKSMKERSLKENKAEAKVQKHTEAVKHEKTTMPRRQVLQR